MNSKLINKLFISFFLLFLFSCESLEFLSEEKEIIDNDTLIKEVKENKTNIILSNNNTQKDVEDFYTLATLKDFYNNKTFSKVATFQTKRKKIQNSKILKSFIYQNQFIFLDQKSNLNIYDLKNFNLIKSVNLQTNIDSDNSYPTSVARINNNFYASYSEGRVLNFNLQGEFIWSKNLKKIIKTPIKIYNNNLIILAGNDIISMDSSTGEINWEFSYGSNEIFQASGGDVVNLNHLLFFILPDGSVGEINTIFNEKNKSIFSQYDFEPSINNSSDKLHAFNNILSYFDQNKYLHSFDIGKNKTLLDNVKISNIQSFKFFNNSIFLLDTKDFLKSLNTSNGKLFWEIDLSNFLKENDKIINVSNLSNSLIFIFESGTIIELNNLNGNIISSQSLKINKISNFIFSNKYMILYHNNNKITLLSQ